MDFLSFLIRSRLSYSANRAEDDDKTPFRVSFSIALFVGYLNVANSTLRKRTIDTISLCAQSTATSLLTQKKKAKEVRIGYFPLRFVVSYVFLPQLSREATKCVDLVGWEERRLRKDEERWWYRNRKKAAKTPSSSSFISCFIKFQST